MQIEFQSIRSFKAKELKSDSNNHFFRIREKLLERFGQQLIKRTRFCCCFFTMKARRECGSKTLRTLFAQM